MIEIFTDGGCHGNPGPGAWAFILKDGDKSFQDSGSETQTTNNKMELTAVIRALTTLSHKVESSGEQAAAIFTDSQYVQKGISEWIHGWMKNGWKTAAKEPVKNKELWQELWALNQKLHPQWRWVKGHAGHPENEACDNLVQEAIKASMV